MLAVKTQSTQEGNEVALFLKNLPFVGESDPAVYFDWNYDVLELLIAGINQNVVFPQAYFVTSLPGQMTIASLTDDFLTEMRRVAGGRCGNGLLAPNTLSQFGNILLVLRDMESNQWLQQHFEIIPQGQSICTIYQITDRSLASASPIGLVVPHGLRQIFQ